MLFSQAAGGFQKLRCRYHQSHVAHHRFHQHRSNRVAVGRKGSLESLGVVVFQYQRVFGRAGGDTGRIRHTKRRCG